MDPMKTATGMRVLTSLVVAAEAHRAHGNDPVPAAAFTTLALSGARDTGDVEQGDLLAYLAVVPVNVANIRSFVHTPHDIISAFAALPHHRFLETLVVAADLSLGDGLQLLAAVAGFPCIRRLEVSGPGAGAVFADVAPRLRSVTLSRPKVATAVSIGAQLPRCRQLRSFEYSGTMNPFGAVHPAELAIAGAISASPQLRRLDLSNFNLGNVDTVAALCASIAKAARAIDVTVSGSGVSPTGAAHFVTALRANRILSLSMRGSTRLGDYGVAALTEGIRASTVLRALCLATCSITSEGAATLAAALAERPTLVRIDVSHNPLRDQGVAMLAAALGGCAELEELSLNDVQLRSGWPLAQAVARLYSLRELCLADHNFDDHALMHVVTAATACPALVGVNLGRGVQGSLRKGTFSDEAVCSIAGLIASSASLRWIDLSGCGFADDDAAVFAAAAENGSLQVLVLRANHIGDGGAAALAAAVRGSRTLLQLQLDGNAVGDKGALAMAAALAAPSCPLRILTLQNNRVSAVTVARVRATCRGSATACYF
jgi:Ran GTPase-activating protein (RanGAP) involved in mRNA processing and transport